ncbi:hypothetical protein P692DRAFT_201806103 [Suillus brevipes Sb2]|nr:hypothetical protein P692DRAFT_201806103 [Suillus brevipes Sb2]
MVSFDNIRSQNHCNVPYSRAVSHTLVQVKVSMYKFYHTLRRMSNNTGLVPLKMGWLKVNVPYCAPHAYTQRRTFQLNGKMSPTYKAVLNANVDLRLSQGWGYNVEEEAYKGFLHSSADSSKEINIFKSQHCTVDYARHNMKWPNAVGDLQKGECWPSNMGHSILPMLNGQPKLRFFRPRRVNRDGP